MAKQIEDKQLEVINEYADAHNLIPVRIVRAGCAESVRKKYIFHRCIELMEKGRPNALLLINMSHISEGLLDCYNKVGLVRNAGFRIFTVEDGEHSLGLSYEGASCIIQI